MQSYDSLSDLNFNFRLFGLSTLQCLCLSKCESGAVQLALLMLMLWNQIFMVDELHSYQYVLPFSKACSELDDF